MRSAKVTTSESRDAEQEVQNFIDKFDPEHQALIRKVRKILRKRLPTAHELVWDNYNFFVIGYSSSERPSDSVVVLTAASNGIGLAFYRGATLPDPHKILLGEGTQNRFIRLESANVLARPEVEALIAAALAQNKVPMSTSGTGTLTIRSISAKQRSRRRLST